MKQVSRLHDFYSKSIFAQKCDAILRTEVNVVNVTSVQSQSNRLVMKYIRRQGSGAREEAKHIDTEQD
jgi:hypothetical protein